MQVTCKPGVIKLKRVRYGNSLYWGGKCTQYITDNKLEASLRKKKDHEEKTPLEVVINIHPERAKRLGLGLQKQSWALVQVYAINVATATLFASLVEYLPNGDWILKQRSGYPRLSETVLWTS